MESTTANDFFYQTDTTDTLLWNQTVVTKEGPADFQMSTEFMVTVYSIVNVLPVIGLVINIVCLAVISKQTNKTSTETLFIGMAVADILFLSTTISIYGITLLDILESDIIENVVVRSIAVYVQPFALILGRAASGSVTAMISIERTFAVHKPTLFRQIWTPKLGKITTTGCFIVPTLALSVYLLTLKDFVMAVVSVLFATSSTVTIIICNIITVYMIRKSNDLLENSNTSATRLKMERERRLTKILLIVTMMYVVCVITEFPMSILRKKDEDFLIKKSAVDIDRFIVRNLLIVVTSIFTTFNSFILVLANAKYRKDLICISCFLNVVKVK